MLENQQMSYQIKLAHKKSKVKFLNNSVLHFLLLPGVIVTLIFSYGPMLGLIMAFQDFKSYSGFTGSKFVGLLQFRNIFSDPAIVQVIFNTLFFALWKFILIMIVPVIFALLLNEVKDKIFKSSIQTIVIFPHFLSWVILAGIFLDVLSLNGGFANNILSVFGIKPIFFLGNESWFRGIIISSYIWQEFGYSAIVFLAALASIDNTYYEASKIDGANRWKQTWHITIPSILPIIAVVATLSAGTILNNGFDQVLNLINPLVYGKGEILDTLAYRIAFGSQNSNFSFATAVGMFKSVISLVLLLSFNKIANKFANYRIF